MSRITQTDIANRAGVSRNCVSKVLNGVEGISAGTRQKVLDTALNMGYAMRPAKEDSVALIVASGTLVNPHWGAFIKGLQEALTENGAHLLIHMAEAPNVMLNDVLTHHSAGAFLIWNRSDALLKALLENGIPTVRYDAPSDMSMEDLACDTLLSASAEPVEELTRRLLALGHRRIAFMGNPECVVSFAERFAGYQKAMTEAGLEPFHLLRASAEEQYDMAYYQRCLPTDLPTACVCANDYIALLLIQVLKARGIAVPADISVTGYDHLQESMLITPELTTVDGHIRELGLRAGQMILTRIRYPNDPPYLLRQRADCLFRASIAEPRQK